MLRFERALISQWLRLLATICVDAVAWSLRCFWSHVLQHARLPCPSPSHGHCSNSCPLSQSVIPSNHLTNCQPLLFALNLSQQKGLFQRIGSLNQVTNNVLELHLQQHQSFQWIFRVDLLLNWLVWSHCFPRDSQVYSQAPQLPPSTTASVLQCSAFFWPNSHLCTWLLKRP